MLAVYIKQISGGAGSRQSVGDLLQKSDQLGLGVAAGEEPDEIMVLGGAEIYRLALPVVDRIYLTSVHGEVAGDTLFPDLDRDQWTETMVGVHPSSAERPIGYSFIILDKKN